MLFSSESEEGSFVMLMQPKSDGHPLCTNALDKDRGAGSVRSVLCLKKLSKYEPKLINIWICIF